MLDMTDKFTRHDGHILMKKPYLLTNPALHISIKNLLDGAGCRKQAENHPLNLN